MVDLFLNGSIINNIELVIFDKDGTLVDLYKYWSQMIGLRSKMICERLKLGHEHKKNLDFEMGVDSDNKKLRDEGPVGIKKREVVMQAAIDYLNSIGFNDTYDICKFAFAETDKLSSEILPELITPINGLYDLFENLNNAQCKIAIATTDKTSRAELVSKYLKLSEKIDFIIGADAVQKSKPDPEMVQKILEELSVKKQNAVMVGDALTDIDMGSNAELKASIGVCTGLTPKEKLLKRTKYVIKDISKIKILLK